MTNADQNQRTIITELLPKDSSNLLDFQKMFCNEIACPMTFQIQKSRRQPKLCGNRIGREISLVQIDTCKREREFYFGFLFQDNNFQ